MSSPVRSRKLLRSSIAQDSDSFAADFVKWPYFGLQVGTDVADLKFTPEELGTDEPAPRIDPNDYVGGYVSERLGGIPPTGQRRKPRDASR